MVRILQFFHSLSLDFFSIAPVHLVGKSMSIFSTQCILTFWNKLFRTNSTVNLSFWVDQFSWDRFSRTDFPGTSFSETHFYVTILSTFFYFVFLMFFFSTKFQSLTFWNYTRQQRNPRRKEREWTVQEKKRIIRTI